MKPIGTLYDRSSGYTRSAVTIIAGLIFVAWPEIIQGIFVYVLGTLILLAGIASLISHRRTAKANGYEFSLLSANGIVSTVFGLLLLFFPSFFISIIMFLFGGILLLLGLFSVFNFIQTRKAIGTPWGYAIVPVLITLCGFSMFFSPKESGNTIFWLFGIALLVYGISELIQTFTNRRRTLEHEADHPESDIEDTPYEEI